MIRVTLEIAPFGDEDKKRTISIMEIINTVDCPDRPEFGNYKVLLDKNEIGKIKRFDRNLGAWKLLQKCLELMK